MFLSSCIIAFIFLSSCVKKYISRSREIVVSFFLYHSTFIHISSSVKRLSFWVVSKKKNDLFLSSCIIIFFILSGVKKTYFEGCLDFLFLTFYTIVYNNSFFKGCHKNKTKSSVSFILYHCSFWVLFVILGGVNKSKKKKLILRGVKNLLFLSYCVIVFSLTSSCVKIPLFRGVYK